MPTLGAHTCMRPSIPVSLKAPLAPLLPRRVTVGLIFPAFRTMQAIEQSSSGTQRWAQFWTLIGILGGIDYLFSFILHHVPLYPYLKLGEHARPFAHRIRDHKVPKV